MKQFYQKHSLNDTLVVLFHGTGGNQYQLLDFAAETFPHADILSYLGDVGEGATRRFFEPLTADKRLQREDFNARVAKQLERWQTFLKKEFYPHVIFVGYSNGANFILGQIAAGIEHVDDVFLLHPSQLDYQFTRSYQSLNVTVTTGANDYISTAGSVKQLVHELENYVPQVTFHLLDGGHELDQIEIKAIKDTL